MRVRGSFPFYTPDQFVREADAVISEALIDEKAIWAAEDALDLRDRQERLRKWAWKNIYSDAGGEDLEIQAIRLVRFIETGSFDEPKA